MDDKKLIDAFKTNRKYFELLRAQRVSNVMVEPEAIDLVLNNAKGNILDAGSGEGAFIKWILKKRPEVNAFGVDISEIGIRMAKEEDGGASFIAANLKQLPFKDDSFDLIYSQSVIEHIVDYDVALKEFHRVLKVGGKLIVRVSNGACHGGKKPLGIFFDTLFNKNEVVKLLPSCEFQTLEEARRNFDAQEIPAGVLRRDFKRMGFRVEYFSTRTHLFKHSDDQNLLKRLALKFIGNMSFFPFTYLGPTTVIMGVKK